MSSTYHIRDEPTGDRSSAMIVNPFWPLLGTMLAGAWLGALFFAVNAWFLRGPTWRREITLAAAILIGSPVIFFGLILADSGGLLPESALSYALLLIVVWKLSLAYWIFFLQQNAFALHEYFAGPTTRAQHIPFGTFVVAGGAVLRPGVIEAFATPFWRIMVS